MNVMHIRCVFTFLCFYLIYVGAVNVIVIYYIANVQYYGILYMQLRFIVNE